MRFEVPQFINIEDKIFGPLTLKQAIYLVGGGALIYILTQVLPSFAALILAIPIAGFSAALAFYKPQGRPFIKMVEAWILYIASQKFYLWRQTDKLKKKVQNIERRTKKEEQKTKDISDEKLSDLAWSLDILDFEN